MSRLIEIVDMLIKEKEDNLQRQEQLKNEIDELPKGTFTITKRGYIYLSYFCDKEKKGVMKYVGKDKAVIPLMQREIEKRKQLEKTLRELRKDLELIEKMLKPVNKRFYQEPVRGLLKDMGEGHDTNKLPPSHTTAIDISKE